MVFDMNSMPLLVFGGLRWKWSYPATSESAFKMDLWGFRDVTFLRTQW